MMDQTGAPGTRVNGQAHAGDLVTYTDQANPAETFEVLSGPDNHGDQYQLRNVETGQRDASDLRQYGWTFILGRTDAEYAAAQEAGIFPVRDPWTAGDRWIAALYGGRLMFHYPLGSVKDQERARQADRLTLRLARLTGSPLI